MKPRQRKKNLELKNFTLCFCIRLAESWRQRGRETLTSGVRSRMNGTYGRVTVTFGTRIGDQNYCASCQSKVCSKNDKQREIPDALRSL